MNSTQRVIYVLVAATFAGPANVTVSAAQTVRVAAISFVPEKFDLQGNANRLEKAFRQAAQGNAKIAVAPEGALDGYVVNEIIAGQEEATRMKEVAIAIDGAMMQRFQRLARELEMCLVFGFAERVGGDIFNSAVFIDDAGEVRGKHHKMQFAEGYDPAWWFNRLGRASRAFDTPFGRCGIMICNDRWNPQLARIPVLDGARFLVIPSFGSRSPAQDEAVLSRGRENQVPVIEANVGVTLVVDKGKIAAVDRQEEGVTFCTITIPAAIQPQATQRDRVEQEFLKQRSLEMSRRLQRTRERRRTNALKILKKLGAKTRMNERGYVIELNLQETSTSDEDLRHITPMAHLKELSLHRTKLTSAGLTHLSGLKHLEKLYLSDTKAGDRGLTALAGLQSLKVLGLSGTAVSNKGLAQLGRLHQLESLFLIDTGVTAEGVKLLQNSLPKCDITY